MRSYSEPIDLSKLGIDWVTTKNDLWEVDGFVEKAKHFEILTKEMRSGLRPAHAIEIKAGKVKEN